MKSAAANDSMAGVAGTNIKPVELLAREFGTIPDLIRAHARLQPRHAALIYAGQSMDYAGLDQTADRVAAALQRDGVSARDVVAICAAASIDYVAVFIGSLRAGAAVAPLATSYPSRTLAAMIADADPRKIFLDRSSATALAELDRPAVASAVLVDGPGAGGLHGWMTPAGSIPVRVEPQPGWACNVIYSSGTTGTPKGIVQPHALRWSNIRRAGMYGYGPGSVTLLATPLYSNLTLATLFGALAAGGSVALMDKFDTDRYLALAEKCRATHTVLVPVQYQRLLTNDNFDRYDLSSFQMKFSTGAPLAAALKQEILQRWPGELSEIYGMTEGGGACVLEARKYPHKLHTVGMPMPRNDIRLIDDAGREVAAGETGEIVGHSPAMMTGYLNQPAKTREAEWYDSAGKRFIRSGDIGRMDADGFLVLMDRKKDMIISGGFNVYPSDLEGVLRAHPAVDEAAVVGIASARWGETPVACVVLKAGADVAAAGLAEWANVRLGKMQRLSAVRIMASLPRNDAGKILKGKLRESIA
jgi:long-chain acyl-CoA synthetase